MGLVLVQYTFSTLSVVSVCAITLYGPCHGLESFLLRPVSSLGNFTRTQSPFLKSRVTALMSYHCLDFFWTFLSVLAAKSRAAERLTRSPCLYSSTVVR